MDMSKFAGVVTASVTPVDAAGRLDEGAIKALTQYYIDSGLNGAFFPSSSGEYFALTSDARLECVRAAVKAAKGKLTIFANISEGSLAAAIQNARVMADAGADCALMMPPAFHHHTQDELCDMYTRLADASPLPVIIYAHLTRLPNKIEVATALKLSEHENIIGIKDTHNDAARLMTLSSKLKARDGFLVYAGGDGMAGFSALFNMEMLNALSAVRPDIFIELYKAGRAGDIALVTELQQRVNRLCALFTSLKGGLSSAALFSQAIKCALSLKGLCGVNAVQLGYEITREDTENVKRVLAGV